MQFIKSFLILTALLLPSVSFASSAFLQTDYSVESAQDGSIITSGLLTASSTGSLSTLCLALDEDTVNDSFFRLYLTNHTQAITGYYATSSSYQGTIDESSFDGTPECFPVYRFNGSTYQGNGYVPVTSGDSISWTVQRLTGTVELSVLGSNSTTSPQYGSQTTYCEIAPFKCSSVVVAYQDWQLIQDFSDPDTRIVDINSPVTGTSTDSSYVTFDFDYFVGSTFVEYAGIELENTFAGQTHNVDESTILQSGAGNFSTTLQLTWSHGYRWRPYLRSGANYVYGPYMSFSVGINPAYATSTLPIGSTFTPTPTTTQSWGSYATTSTSSQAYTVDVYEIDSWCSETNFIATLSYKFPFSYICDFGTIINELGSGTANPDVVVTIPSTIFAYEGDVHIPIIDKDFLASLELLQFIKQIIAFSLWFGFAVHVYFALMSILKFGQWEGIDDGESVSYREVTDSRGTRGQLIRTKRYK